MTRPAYIVDDCDDGCVAELLGDSQAAEYREQGIKVRRCREFDQYAESGIVPDHAWLALGWELECRQCGRDFTDATVTDEDGEEYDSDPQHVGDVSLCSPACAEAYRERRARITARRAEGEAALRSRCPWVVVEQWFTGSPGGCNCFSPGSDNQAAQITFDGARVGNNHYCHGCGNVTVCNGDDAAWEAARAKAKGGAA